MAQSSLPGHGNTGDIVNGMCRYIKMYCSHFATYRKVATTSRRVHLIRNQMSWGEAIFAWDLHCSSIRRQLGKPGISIGLRRNTFFPFFSPILLFFRDVQNRITNKKMTIILWRNLHWKQSAWIIKAHLKKSLGSVLMQWRLRSPFFT